jgi:hypothetical protein
MAAGTGHVAAPTIEIHPGQTSSALPAQLFPRAPPAGAHGEVLHQELAFRRSIRVSLIIVNGKRLPYAPPYVPIPNHRGCRRLPAPAIPVSAASHTSPLLVSACSAIDFRADRIVARGRIFSEAPCTRSGARRHPRTHRGTACSVNSGTHVYRRYVR